MAAAAVGRSPREDAGSRAVLIRAHDPRLVREEDDAPAHDRILTELLYLTPVGRGRGCNQSTMPYFLLPYF